MAYRHSSIMHRAWDIYRTVFKLSQTRVAFRMALQDAWAEAKHAVALNIQAASEGSEIRRVKDAMFALECKDRWSPSDYAEMDRLRGELQALMARAAEEKRALIESAQGRFVSVVFTKKDGTLRHMRVQPAKLKFHVKGDRASEAAQRAVETRSRRHPHLMPVWDADAQGPRSVNLVTVSCIAVNGAVHEFQIQ